MIAIDDMFRQPVAQALGWALLQFVWQGALVGLLTAALLAVLRRSAADVRYVVSTAALAMMLTMPVVTAIQTPTSIDARVAASQGLQMDGQLAGPEGPARRETAPASVGQGLQTLPTSGQRANASNASASAPAPWSIDDWLPMLLSVWLTGVVTLTLRLFSGWMWVQRMKSRDAQPVRESLETMGRRLMRRLHIVRAVRFLESKTVDVPTVIGWLRPVVLLPVSTLAGLTPRQVEAILAHELAHIRRHDYLVNLLQVVVETLLFYHPAVWWLSHRIRVERENCCDDLAVSLCGDPVAYAAALAELEGLRGSSGELALAASGGSLLQRIKRVLGAPTHAGRAPGWLAAGMALLLVAALSVSAATTDARGSGQGEITAAGDDQIHASTPALPPAAAPSAPLAAPAAPDGPLAVAAPPSPVHAPVAASPSSVHAPVVAAQVATVPVEAPAVASTSTVEAAFAPVPPAASTEESRAAVMAAAATTVPGIAAAQVPSSPVAAVVASTKAAFDQTVSTRGDSSGNYVWSDNGRKIEINYRGDIDFTNDDTDVARMSPGGMLRIREGRRLLGADTSVEFTADGAGNITRKFWQGWKEQPFEPEGRKWLATMLPRFIRQSGIGAPARVARIHKSGGVTGVLAEISRVEGSWAKHVYLKELMKVPGLTAADVQRAFNQAGAEIDSDFELATFLISSSRQITDDATRRAYLDAAKSIGSDFELRRVLSSVLQGGAVPSPLAAGLLETSTSIDSDFEEASLLVQFARQQPIDATVRAPFFKALATVGSSFEHARVLQTLLQRTDLSPETRASALESAGAVDSDFEAANVLLQFVKAGPIEGTIRAPFFRAAGTINSAFERSRVLQAVAKRTDLSAETVLELVRSTKDISSNFERSQVLLAVASNHQLERDARDAYIDASEGLGDFEQGRVLSALVKNERRSSR
jgi:beta-lactamase regulating signal transducer with metallopeptidase domain